MNELPGEERFSQLIAQLKNTDEAIHAQAFLTLQELTAEEIVAVFIAVLQAKLQEAEELDDTEALEECLIVLEEAMQKLEEKTHAVISVLISLLQTNLSPEQWEVVVPLLGLTGSVESEAAVQALIAIAQNDENAEHRAQAVAVLQMLGERGGKTTQIAVPALLEVFQNDEDWTVRSATAHALNAIGIHSEKDVDLFIEILQQEIDEWVLAAAGYLDGELLEAVRARIPDFKTTEERLEENFQKIDEVNQELEADKKRLQTLRFAIFQELFEQYKKISLENLAKQLSFSVSALKDWLQTLPKKFGYEIIGTEIIFIEPSKLPKALTCFYCGAPLSKEQEKCLDCGRAVLQCVVCKLPICFGEAIGKCSLCEAKGHLTHLQEWVKTQGKCPKCLQEKIDFKGLVREIEERQHSAYKLYQFVYQSKALTRLVKSMDYKGSLRNHFLLMVNLAINDYLRGKLRIKNGTFQLLSSSATDA
ncbi:MAG: hypothetical protein GF308_00655 [Candidatus Heimdallarchaeota archaeon]|nr:hypothetical protein [Candidatus Heimdallarchaeota archaeon]